MICVNAELSTGRVYTCHAWSGVQNYWSLCETIAKSYRGNNFHVKLTRPGRVTISQQTGAPDRELDGWLVRKIDPWTINELFAVIWNLYNGALWNWTEPPYVGMHQLHPLMVIGNSTVVTLLVVVWITITLVIWISVSGDPKHYMVGVSNLHLTPEFPVTKSGCSWCIPTFGASDPKTFYSVDAPNQSLALSLSAIFKTKTKTKTLKNETKGVSFTFFLRNSRSSFSRFLAKK